MKSNAVNKEYFRYLPQLRTELVTTQFLCDFLQPFVLLERPEPEAAGSVHMLDSSLNLDIEWEGSGRWEAHFI